MLATVWYGFNYQMFLPSAEVHIIQSVKITQKPHIYTLQVINQLF